MKPISILIALLTFAPLAHGENWTPTRLTLTADPVIEYAFDGEPLQFTVNVAGTPSKTVFCVFTNDQTRNIIDIQNGYLGWHYVNKIDTCIYYAIQPLIMPGNNTVTWSGLDMDGNWVSPGSYTYYLKGYDSVNPKQVVASVIEIGNGRYDTIISQDYNGVAYDRPILYTDPFAGTRSTDTVAAPAFIPGRDDRAGQISGEYVNRMKFPIGGDPDDPSVIEKTWYPVWFEHCQYRPSPYDPDMFYIVTNDIINHVGHMRRYTWVPNGESAQDMDWGDNGEVTWSILAGGNWWARMSACFEYIGEDQFIGCNTDHGGYSTVSELPVIDAIDGYIVRTIDLSEWWIRPEDDINGDRLKGQQSSGPNYAEFRMVHGEPLLSLTAHSSCLQHVINPHDPDGDYDRWINGNGDYIADHNWEPDDDNPWVCNDYGPPARTYTASLDNHGFVMSSALDEAAGTVHLFAPDGSGLEVLTFPDDFSDVKYINLIVQTGGAYDGIYTDNVIDECRNPAADCFQWADGVNYIAHDSIRGYIIGGDIGVEEAFPAAFTVEQNTPNPFNPSTTISFMLAQAGEVAVDVYNIAGQKIDTLADGHMEAGSHSIAWDATGFAAGMYFCTVRAGDSVKTIKMTLVK